MKQICICLFLLFFSFVYATIINIPADQPTIQEGINVAVNGDTVLVQPDTYYENINYNGKNITVASLFYTTQDTSYISQTIIDGDSIDSVVTFASGEDSTAVLYGFTITNGYSYAYGGGIYCNNNSSPSLLNVTIIDNTANDYGGGICCCDSSNTIIENVIITGNSANFDGGGISCLDYSSPSLTNVIISDNSAFIGGGISCRVNSSPTLTNVTISGNSADGAGGIHCNNSSPTLTNVTISDNSASYSGGGISCNWYCSPNLQNVTISGNSASSGGGIFCYWNSNPTLMNCILWNNSPEEICFSSYNDQNSITISYSDIQGGEAGIVTNNNGTVNWLEGNIDEDPLFVGTGEHPYSLLEGSPCIDAGIPDTTGLNLPSWDIIGNLRIWDGDGNGSAIIDMGAYEYGAPPYVDVDDNIIVQTPEVFLHQNYPNPFNPSTTIYYNIIEAGNVSIEVFNIKGQKVKTLVNEKLPAGEHSTIWNGRDSNNKRVGSGVYFYKLNVNGKTEAVKKCLLLK
ncbi:MAG: T9SS type A sorting domain-containing protein [Candidatus Cloacimonetes bacterium]|nr:T9SS type A sorting domain-containing protein [Candidatus Cloacimonadota bacterium]